MKLQDIAAELIGYKEGCPSGEGLLDVILSRPWRRYLVSC